jgi:hypothetical protein
MAKRAALIAPVLATSLGGRDPLTSLRKACALLFVSQSTAESGINGKGGFRVSG